MKFLVAYKKKDVPADNRIERCLNALNDQVLRKAHLKFFHVFEEKESCMLRMLVIFSTAHSFLNCSVRGELSRLRIHSAQRVRRLYLAKTDRFMHCTLPLREIFVCSDDTLVFQNKQI